ncbi:MAG: Unknown protein [uncultured Sulfurovum sp.]|uniref:Uncharacterized protein n=1 Tax=uncultured Sulfurovum sp. TaxID=269237 RepID=A0A6S6U2A4_9BACT|nr:MAG: Unknown protein [uncultured Sulfurovum sp.]
MGNLDVATLLVFVLFFFIGIGSIYLFKLIKFDPLRAKQKKTRTNRQKCRIEKRIILKQNWTDYFWSHYMRSAWILLILTFTIALCFAIGNIVTIIIGILITIITFFFLRFAIKSYKAFPDKAKEALSTFEAEVHAALEKEVSFNGDNIQSFTDNDQRFDTKPQIFSFPIGITKIPFPPYEKNAKKHPIIATKKLEFLVLSREYFSICKNASSFNLLEPALAPEMKECARKKGISGDCHEHYYSQMRNVEYDGEKETIRILYYDGRDDVEFACKKLAPNRKAALKALKEKLRLTERQRLQKIDEHEKYEEILQRRERENKEEPSPDNS